MGEMNHSSFCHVGNEILIAEDYTQLKSQEKLWAYELSESNPFARYYLISIFDKFNLLKKKEIDDEVEHKLIEAFMVSSEESIDASLTKKQESAHEGHDYLPFRIK